MLESCKYGYSRLTTNTAAFGYSRQKTSQCFIIQEKPSDSDNSNERECATKMTYNNDFCLRKRSYTLVANSQNWRPLIISIKRQSSLYTCNESLYSGTSLKRTLTGQKLLSAVERCLPWRGLNWKVPKFKVRLFYTGPTLTRTPSPP